MEIEILFQHPEFVVVNKPSGWLVHRTKEAPDQLTLLQMVRDQVGCHVYPVHRLDRGASGAMVYALSSAATAKVQAALAETDAAKVYWALVRGEMKGSGTIDKPLTSDDGEIEVAVSHYAVLDSCQYCSLVEVQIETGRRHQIRRHLSGLTHQILGDRSHGKGRVNNFYRDQYGLGRMFLHSRRLQFEWEGQQVKVDCPLPPDLRQVIQTLRDQGLFAGTFDIGH